MKYFYLIKIFFLFPVLFIFFFLIFFEIFFFCFYSFSKLKYFENFRETKIRYNFNYDEIEKENYRKIKKDLGSKKIKVAIFGGSSARGYPFDTNFSDILQEVVGQNYIIHNFSKNGEPFVDFQSKKLLLLRKYYDYLIIYSGNQLKHYQI